MDENEIRASLDELDADLSGAHAMASGSHWPSTALACAMVDAGLIEKSGLLKIVDTLMAIASAFAVTAETDPAYSAHSLEAFRRQLEQLELKPGSVLKDLEQIELGATEAAIRYHQMLKNEEKKGRDEGKAS